MDTGLQMEENDTCIFIHLGKVIPSQNIAVAGVFAAGLLRTASAINDGESPRQSLSKSVESNLWLSRMMAYSLGLSLLFVCS